MLFVDKDTLLAQAFDADRLELKGQPFFVAEHVGRNTSFLSAVSASRNGTIVYARLLSQNGRLSWIDRHGNRVGSPVTPEGDYTDFRLSPDETRLAGSLADPKANVVEIWITDLARGGSSRIGSGGGVTAAAIWSPDGTRLAFRSNRTGVIDMDQRSALGGGVDRPLLPPDYSRAPGLIPTDWSLDGRHLLGGSGNDLLLIPLATGGKPEKLIASPGTKMHGNFSPDGRLVVYTSNESGRFEIYETVPLFDRKVARLDQRRIRTALAGGWTRDLLPFRRRQADGRPGRAGSPFRDTHAAVPVSRPHGCHGAAHALRPEP